MWRKRRCIPGKWMLHVTAHSGDGVLFQQRLNLFVKG